MPSPSSHYESDSDSGSDFDLPFPAPLSSLAFSSDSFSAATFLTNILRENRHQALEDLRAELRTRQRDLSRELIDLVNRDYADFISLGRGMHEKGGEGKVEDLRAGLMSIRRGLEDVRSSCEHTRVDMDKAMRERTALGEEKNLVRTMILLHSRLRNLSSALLLTSTSMGPGMLQDGEDLSSVSRLRRLVDSMVYVDNILLEKVPAGHPFTILERNTLERARETLAMDLVQALKEAIYRGDHAGVLELLEMCAEIKIEPKALAAMRNH